MTVLLGRGLLRNGEVFFEAHREERAYRLCWPRAGSARLSERGRIVRFSAAPRAEATTIHVIRRIVRAYADSLRGKEALHATVLDQGGRALALLGPSGQGKSTLAAFLLRRDPSVRLLTDDLLYVNCGATTACALRESGAARLKLSRRSRERCGFARAEFDANLEKEIVAFPEQRGGLRRVPLAAFVQLARGTRRRRLVRVRGARAALVLMANVYNEILRPPRVLRRQFELCTALAGIVPVYRLEYPSGWNRLPAVSRRIETVWTR